MPRSVANANAAACSPGCSRLWTYAGSVVAHALFLDLPGSALWGALGMGLVAVPLAVRLVAGSRPR